MSWGGIVFALWGRIINHAWAAILVGWLVAFVALRWVAPPWSQVVEDGQFSFLPEDSPSRRGDELFNDAFPHDLLASSIVITLARDEPQGMDSKDFDFISKSLRPRLQKLADEKNASPTAIPNSTAEDASQPPLVGRIRAFDDKGVGALLDSHDKKATLIILEMTNDFASEKNRPVIEGVEKTFADLAHEALTPAGLSVELTGSAVVGRDIARASEASARSIGLWTIVLVTSLTLIVFRAPLLAVLPLITLFVAMDVALKLLALLAGHGFVGLFKGIEAYSTVVVYASGVDYSLFLISRFKEELDAGGDLQSGVGTALGKVGAAIAASAATEIAGIGMMSFAKFGKFHEAGIAISFSLFIMLLAVTSLTPALLRLAGRAAFWPHRVRSATPADESSPVAPPEESRFQRIWERIAGAVLRRPGLFWLATTAAMVPFAVVGVWRYNNLNYDLVGNLPHGAASARGMKLLEAHFPAGAVGPVNLLVENDAIDFRTSESFPVLKTLTDRLYQHRESLNLADVRSVAAPLGVAAAGRIEAHGGLTERLVTAAATRRISEGYFVTSNDRLEGGVARFELELSLNPFSEMAMDILDHLEGGVRRALPDEISEGSTLMFNGSTASLRDLKNIGARDRTLINVLVVVCIFVILVVLLRRVVLTVYLLLTVFLSYLMTLGVTDLFFQQLDPQGFHGLDWTVPLFLFTVLIAIGEDYNILLVTRIHEEERRSGTERGVSVALARTGPIISSCGFIMAGTFLSLAIAGQLAQMIQLGFALAFGVMLDTFIVRPILVPSYVLLVDRIPNWSLRRILGA